MDLRIDTSDPLPSAETIPGRILQTAREHLFRFGCSAFTMDDLARDLGMSKKTLYVHFPSKEAIIDSIIDHIARTLRGRLETITTDRKLGFVPKLSAMIEILGGLLSRVSPIMLRDLERFFPTSYAKIEAMRGENVPLFFGRLIRQGIESGKVRADLDADFATQFWLQAIRGLIQPAVLERTHLSPKQTLEKAIDLFFGGLLTSAGRLDYEKLTTLRKK